MTLALALIAATIVLAAVAGAVAGPRRPPVPKRPAGRLAFGARLRDRGPEHLVLPPPHVHAPRRLGELLAVRRDTA